MTYPFYDMYYRSLSDARLACRAVTHVRKYNSGTRALNHLERSKSLLDDSSTLHELFLIADILGYP
jgi:hypothetical protein